MKKLVKILQYTVFSFATLFISCNVGLGPSVDLMAPTVTILSPENSDTVSTNFTVTGNAFDNTEVTELVVTCSKESKTIQNFKYSNGKWQIQEGNSFVDYLGDSSFTKNEDGEVSWSLALTLGEGASVEDGEYEVSVSATDAMKNTSSKSVAEIVLRYDTNAPSVVINQPDVSSTKTLSQIQAKYNSISDYKDSNIVNNFYSDDVTISGIVQEAFGIKSLQLALYNGTSTSSFYTTGVLTEADFEDSENYTGSLRSFNVKVAKSTFNTLGNGKKYISIKAIAVDQADNGKELTLSSQTSLGYFVWWPESNTPWIEIESLKASNTVLYGSMTIPISVYDNNGVKTVSYTIKKSSTTVASGELYNNDGSKSWETLVTVSVPVPEDTGNYTISVNAKDNDNLSATSITKNFEVKDVGRPSIEVTNKDSLSCYGNSDGQIDFSLTAKDDSGVKNIFAIYIKNQDDYGKYLDPNNSIWNNISAQNTISGDYVKLNNDANGNLVWQIKPIDTNTQSNGQKIYSASLSLNIFEDLGIDGINNTLSAQSFIFYVKETGTDAKASTFECVLSGDTELPSITIKEFTIKNATGTKTYTVNGTKITEKGKNQEISKLPPIGANEKILISGDWEENSFTKWNNVNKLILELSINGSSIESSNIIINPNKTWTTREIDLPSLSSNLSVSAVLKDFAKNSKEVSFSKSIEGITPSLTELKVDQTAGSYTTGQKFEFSLKFNKAVKISNSKTPTLTLHFDENKSKTLNLENLTNANNIHKFATYTAEEGYDTSKLSVTLNLNGATFIDLSNVVASTNSYSKFTDTKDIAILTKKLQLLQGYPKLQSNDTEIVFKFNQNITAAQNQNIIVTQDNVYVPIVLSEDEYKELKNKNSTFAQTYYEAGTNGTDQNGNVDISTKYILKYENNANDSSLVNTYKTTYLHQRTYTTGSSCISIGGDTLTIDLSEKANKLPVKGTSYTVNVPKGLVLNAVNAQLDFEGDASKNFTLTTSGCEEPVIRVQKVKPTLSNDYNGVQPLTTNVKIDCQTPNSSIYYKTNVRAVQRSTDINKNYKEDKSLKPANDFPKITSAPTNASTAYTQQFVLGKNGASNYDYTYGLKYSVAAIAYSSGNQASNVSYNAAFRTSFIIDGGNVTIQNYGGSNPRCYLAGGDKIDGDVTTAGFPLSWDPTEGKLKIMTKTGNIWYYVTWDINVTAYVKTACGPTDTHSADYGPTKWGWSVNAFTSMVDCFPVFPGEARYFDQSWNTNNGGYDFSPTVQGIRDDAALGI